MIPPVQPVEPGTVERWLGGRTFAEVRERFDTVGYVIIEGVLDADDVERVRRALGPHLDRDVEGRNDFEGYRSNRVYGLLAKDPVFGELVAHPLALAFAEADLGESCLLSAALAINLKPGETAQSWHFDDAYIEIPMPRPSYGVSTFWAIDAMTDDNGATELIPGSHLTGGFDDILVTSDDYRPGGRARASGADDPMAHPSAIKATMTAGSLMVAKGTLVHRGGANRSDRPRLIVTPQYCPGWARQIENQMSATPPDVAERLPKRVRELIGYSLHGAFMGYVDGRHPARLLPETR